MICRYLKNSLISKSYHRNRLDVHVLAVWIAYVLLTRLRLVQYWRARSSMQTYTLGPKAISSIACPVSVCITNRTLRSILGEQMWTEVIRLKSNFRMFSQILVCEFRNCSFWFASSEVFGCIWFVEGTWWWWTTVASDSWTSAFAVCEMHISLLKCWTHLSELELDLLPCCGTIQKKF